MDFTNLKQWLQASERTFGDVTDKAFQVLQRLTEHSSRSRPEVVPAVSLRPEDVPVDKDVAIPTVTADELDSVWLPPEGTAGGLHGTIFSFGLLYYYLLTGHHPFERETRDATVQAIATEPPTPLNTYIDDPPELLKEIVTGLLQKDPEQRYQSFEAIRHDLRRLRPQTVPESKPRRDNWNRYVVVTAAVLMFVLGAWGIYDDYQRHEAPVAVVVVAAGDRIASSQPEDLVKALVDMLGSHDRFAVTRDMATTLVPTDSLANYGLQLGVTAVVAVHDRTPTGKSTLVTVTNTENGRTDTLPLDPPLGESILRALGRQSNK